MRGKHVIHSNVPTSRIENPKRAFSEKIDEDLDQIRTAVGNYQSKLKAAVAEIENEDIETENIMEVMS